MGTNYLVGKPNTCQGKYVYSELFYVNIVEITAYLARPRLRAVAYFDDGDCGAGEIHTHARVKFRGDATRRERLNER